MFSMALLFHGIVLALSRWRAIHGELCAFANPRYGTERNCLSTKAYEQTLRVLCVKDRDDPLTELVAKTIIKIAQKGLKDPAQISAQAITELELR
ncbi:MULTISPECIES: hypothetical protein [Bradyrhizobium]|uniref:hypothetical protein n=2 Tax=Bradyrhizobium TaxID=374 RepID=UPI001FD9D6AA|nr:hypothetical protein [Bradyrhizobium japonicum]WLB91380.1 hypothetical protein QIH91_13800 [Bradyrhizobium japonicum USDA 135]GLR94155.1 hypothetical protein GCM10007858_17830 [Bradyrhizobium liaoningense]